MEARDGRGYCMFLEEIYGLDPHRDTEVVMERLRHGRPQAVLTVIFGTLRKGTLHDLTQPSLRQHVTVIQVHP